MREWKAVKRANTQIRNRGERDPASWTSISRPILDSNKIGFSIFLNDESFCPYVS